MKRFLLLMSCLPLVLGACSESETDDTVPKKGGTPEVVLPAGTKDEPIGVDQLMDAVGKTAVWIEGYVVGAENAVVRSVPQVKTKSNILLAASATETDNYKCSRIDLEDESDIQARLNIVDHPDLVGTKIKVQGDIVRTTTGSAVKVTNVTAQEGGKDPSDNPEPDPDPDPEPEPDPVDPPITGNVELDRLYGYAEGTTGGEGATTANIHHFDNGKKFGEWLYLREKNKDKTPAIVWLSGTFHKDEGRGSGSPWFDIKRTSNISIYGTDNFVMENVGFFLNEASNIIIRNIYIKMPKADNGADGISMQESNNVWVDHCTFESINQVKDYEDGSCDVTHATYNVTVSWCHFIKTQKSCLVGHSNGASADTKITVTFHHNYFDLSNSRHPRVRFGKAHVYNNFFNQVATYGVGSAYSAMVLVEDNFFESVRLPTDICTYPAKPSGSSWVSNLTGSVAGFLYERGNIFANRPSNATDPYPFTNVEYKAYNGEKLPTPYTYEDFKPTYSYIVDDADQIPTIVPSGAGTKRLPGYAQAPIPVNNGNIAGPDPDPNPGPDPDPTPNPGQQIGNGWTLVNNGAAAAVASGTGNTLTLTACGKFESGTQTFGYVYRELTGNFTLTVQIDEYQSQKTTGNQSLAGIFITPDYAATANDLLHAMAAQGPDGFHHSSRAAVGNAASKGNLSAPATNTGTKPILKLERDGDKCKLSYSLDGGATFGSVSSKSIEGLPDKVYVGLAANSGDGKKTSTIVFKDFMIDGQAVAFSE